jgi:uncharacterized Tic20 family protein
MPDEAPNPDPAPNPSPDAAHFGAPTARLVDPSATPEQKTYCVLMHLTLLLYFALPILALAAPIIMWLIRRKDARFIDDHGKETVNFHISLMIYGLAAVILSLPLIPIGIGVCTSFVGYYGVLLLGVIGMLMASFAANQAEYYRYPACIRFIR